MGTRDFPTQQRDVVVNSWEIHPQKVNFPACYVSDYTPKAEHPSEKDPHKPTNHQMFRGFNGLGTMPVRYMAYPPPTPLFWQMLCREKAKWFDLQHWPHECGEYLAPTEAIYFHYLLSIWKYCDCSTNTFCLAWSRATYFLIVLSPYLERCKKKVSAVSFLGPKKHPTL